jgi:glucosamine kinase
MIEYFIGIDGGGTGTRAHVVRASADDAVKPNVASRVLGSGHAGPSALRQGVAQAWREIESAIRAAFQDAKLAVPAWDHCVLGAGLSGVGHLPSRASFLESNPGFADIVLDSDGFVTLLGAHGGKPGAIVAFGTGSVGESLHADGRREIVGGWGFPVGDEGSGAWMGLRAMAVAQAALDGRAATGALARGVYALAGVQGKPDANRQPMREGLQTWCGAAAQFAYAQLAPAVFDTAAEDEAAETILRDAAAAMARVAIALDKDAKLPLAISGSIGQRLLPRLSADIQSRVVEAQSDAATGALHLIARAALQPKQSTT